MPTDLAATLDVEDLDAPSGEQVRAGQDVGRIGATAEGQDSVVLEDEQGIRDAAGDPGGMEPLLELPRVAIEIGRAHV